MFQQVAALGGISGGQTREKRSMCIWILCGRFWMTVFFLQRIRWWIAADAAVGSWRDNGGIFHRRDLGGDRVGNRGSLPGSGFRGGFGRLFCCVRGGVP